VEQAKQLRYSSSSGVPRNSAGSSVSSAAMFTDKPPKELPDWAPPVGTSELKPNVWDLTSELAEGILEFSQNAKQSPPVPSQLERMTNEASLLKTIIDSMLQDQPLAEKLCLREWRKRTRECSSCHTKESSQWRRGPRGSKTLCNACGLKYWRKRKAINSKRSRTEKLSDVYMLLN